MEHEKPRFFDTWWDVIILLGGLGHVAGIVLTITHFFPHLMTDSKIGVSYIIIMSALFSLYILYKYRKARDHFLSISNIKDSEIQNLRSVVKQGVENERYVKSMPHINAAFSHIHDLHRYLDIRQSDFNEIEKVNDAIELSLNELRAFCDDVAAAFTLNTGVSCNVCIKFYRDIVGDDDSDLAVYTFIRDDKSERERYTAREEKVVHKISANSSYKYVHNNLGHPKGRYYFNNRLPFTPSYENTSFAIYGSPTVTSDCDNDTILKGWPLPYKSQITCALVPNLTHKFKREHLRGFLGIDTGDIDAFDESTDTALLIGISDGIYNTVDKIVKLLAKRDELMQNNNPATA